MKDKFDALLERKTTESHMKRWWNTNRYKVCRVIFFPIWIVVLVKDEVCESRYRNIQWSESRADRIIAKTVPQKLEVCDDELCYCLEWQEPWENSSRLHFGDKIFGRKFSHEIAKYLKEDYQVDGYQKRLESPSPFEHWVVFQKYNSGTR